MRPARCSADQGLVQGRTPFSRSATMAWVTRVYRSTRVLSLGRDMAASCGFELLEKRRPAISAGRSAGSVGAGRARPDQAVALVGVDQAGVDRSREARVVQLDREVGPVLAGGLHPGGAEFGVAGEDAVVRGLVVVLLDLAEDGGLDVEGQGLDRAVVVAGVV